MAAQGFGSLHHLATRFFGALSPAGPTAADEAWAMSSLLAGEQELWRRMSGPDRRHAVGVARDTIRLLDADPPPRPVVAAALLHDVGKVESSFGTFARVGVTVAALVVGRDRLVRWAGTPATPTEPAASTEPATSTEPARPAGAQGRALRRRVGLYLTHDGLGAGLLERAGSDHLTVSWAQEHHWATERWTVDARVGAALKAADGD